jgi:hypothetical protein
MVRFSSNTMYTCLPLYDTFCRGIESGKLRACPTRKPTPLQTMCTIAHEAHFRCEVAGCVMQQGFRWGLGTADVEQREKGFEEMCERVAADRENNADTAWDQRLALLGPKINDDDCSSSDDAETKKTLLWTPNTFESVGGPLCSVEYPKYICFNNKFVLRTQN